jgi:hypothetical protein
MWRPIAKISSVLIGALGFSAAVEADAAAAQRDSRAAPGAWAAPNASQAEAKYLADRADSRAFALELRNALQLAPETVLEKIDAAIAAGDLPWPAVEAALMQLQDALGQLHRDQVPGDLMARLSAWQARTLVAHEEMASLGTALYPIAARAQGLENRWRRDEARALGAEQLGQGIQIFLTQWAATTDAAARAGLLDALDQAPASRLRALLNVTRQSAKASSDRRIPLSRAALALHDVGAMSTLLALGGGAEMRPLLQSVAARMNADELTALLSQLRRDADTPTLALAIGVWSPMLSGHAPAEKLLLDWLDDADIGSSAALALSVQPSPSARARLNALAATPATSLGARRARLALQLDQVAEMPR